MTAPANLLPIAATTHPTKRLNQTRIVRDAGPTTRLRAQQTLAKMRDTVRAELPVPLVWETARQIIAGVAPRDEVSQATTIRAWCDTHFKFVNDPWDVQLLTSPTYLLEHIAANGYVQGNCADAAMLSAALCMAVHLRCRFYAVAFRTPEAPYSHVFTVAYARSATGDTAVEMDFTRPPDLQKATFTRRLMLDV